MTELMTADIGSLISRITSVGYYAAMTCSQFECAALKMASHITFGYVLSRTYLPLPLFFVLMAILITLALWWGTRPTEIFERKLAIYGLVLGIAALACWYSLSIIFDIAFGDSYPWSSFAIPADEIIVKNTFNILMYVIPCTLGALSMGYMLLLMLHELAIAIQSFASLLVHRCKQGRIHCA